ncbi:hypothetical protein IMX26_10160 [Clostridium sp. 'deep sea']|uniref:hypothetical protein n=1 Tax=Clostridium sp. 'deep sea' TaxID=2779445 RepID=UPI0018963F13|nr:hypothetical protein [Clostridium sp. 'deep sea']QOR33861.1 hypothetical protein IMX26_10160 [Clostridium sp. 'deep sea']
MNELEQAIANIVQKAVDQVVENIKPYPSNWPKIINPTELSGILGISRPKADELMARKDFPTVYITQSYKRVGAQALWKWLNNELYDI